MRKILIIAALVSFQQTNVWAQLPIAYYDFENNSTRTTMDLNAELAVNSATSITSPTTITQTAGAGTYYGGSANGSASNISNLITLLTGDPGAAAATSYQQFDVNTSGFQQISLSFSYKQGGIAALSNPFVSAGYSVDGGSTWTSLNLALSYSTSWNVLSNAALGSNANNTTVTIRIYQYVSGLVSLTPNFSIDNIIVGAGATHTGKTFVSLSETAIYTGFTSGSTGSIFNRGSFNVSGAGAALTLGSNMAFGSGSTLTVETGTSLITNNGSVVNAVTGAGNVTLQAGAYLYISSTAGLSTTASTGNIQVTGSRILAAGAHYVYNNPLSAAQATGNNLPVSISGSVIINNSNGVTLTNVTTIANGGLLHLLDGAFTNTVGLTIAAGATINRANGSLTAYPTFGNGMYLTYSGANAVNTGFEAPNVTTALADVTLQKTNATDIVTVTNPIWINDNLYLNKGVLRVQNTTVTLRSTATNTARVAPIVATDASIGYVGTGQFAIERYLFAKKAWRFIATPIQAADATTIYAAWQENGSMASTGYGTQITGPVTAIGVDQITPRSSIKYFDGATNNFIDVLNTGNPIYNSRGYFVFVRGDRSINTSGTTGATTLRLQGKLFTGTQSYSIPANQFLSVGNPYASRLNIKQAFENTGSGGLVNAFTVWNPNNAGSYNVGAYETYIRDISTGNYLLNGSGAMKNDIESGQAFMVQATGSTGNFSVAEVDKNSGSALVSKGVMARTDVVVPALAIQLLTNDVAGTSYIADGVLLNFDAGFSTAIDAMDVRKIFNSADNIAIKNGTNNLVVERRPHITVNDTIQLMVSGLRVAHYQLNIAPTALPYPGLQAILKDKFTGIDHIVSVTNITDIGFDVTSNPQSYASDRFMMVFRLLPPTQITSITAERFGNETVQVVWQTINENNMDYYELQRSTDSINFTSIGSQIASANNMGTPYYIINDATASRGDNWYRVVGHLLISNTINSTTVKVAAAAPIAQSMGVYPNPVVGDNIHVRFNRQAMGDYQINIYNAVGQLIHHQALSISNVQQATTITIPQLAKGKYELILVGNDGKKQNVQFIK
ncbi:T9SS type A sorting domain-containing protein [Ferruginibacter yonginensis]|uniref:T9SS type A sorting domain-containing protein n=1 Tax=Ferruginibacter yonginensis TaxID=1310416 RepID=A0ABV8QQD2_9BACT